MGGLPAGIEGRAVIELKSKKDIFASLLMMKRGVEMVFVENNFFYNHQSFLSTFFSGQVQSVKSIGDYKKNINRGPCVIVKGSTINDEVQKSHDGSFMYLYPLVAMSNTDVKLKLEKLVSLVSECR